MGAGDFLLSFLTTIRHTVSSQTYWRLLPETIFGGGSLLAVSPWAAKLCFKHFVRPKWVLYIHKTFSRVKSVTFKPAFLSSRRRVPFVVRYPRLPQSEGGRKSRWRGFSSSSSFLGNCCELALDTCPLLFLRGGRGRKEGSPFFVVELKERKSV